MKRVTSGRGRVPRRRRAPPGAWGCHGNRALRAARGLHPTCTDGELPGPRRWASRGRWQPRAPAGAAVPASVPSVKSGFVHRGGAGPLSPDSYTVVTPLLRQATAPRDLKGRSCHHPPRPLGQERVGRLRPRVPPLALRCRGGSCRLRLWGANGAAPAFVPGSGGVGWVDGSRRAFARFL